MKILLLSIFFAISFSNCSAQNDTVSKKNAENITLQIETLDKKRDSLEKKVNEYKACNNSVIEVVDKIDNLYNNNFNRFIIFWGIIASVIIIGIPFYITRMQRKIIEVKKNEIFSFSKTEINKLEEKLSSELKEKYSELNTLINQSTESNKENLKKEFIKANSVSFYLAAKINEIDKSYKMLFKNLVNAILKANSIEEYSTVNFHLNNILTTFTKLTEQGVDLSTVENERIIASLETLNNTEEIDQELLEKVITLLQG